MIKPNTKVTIAIDFDLAALSRVPDAHLAMLWHVAQANPAPHGDEQAGELVAKVGHEIIRRWLAGTQPEMYHHQERSYYWTNLGRFASYRDGDWRPDPVKLAKYEEEQATSAASSSGEYLQGDEEKDTPVGSQSAGAASTARGEILAVLLAAGYSEAAARDLVARAGRDPRDLRDPEVS